jgi:hypothetical protein
MQGGKYCPVRLRDGIEEFWNFTRRFRNFDFTIHTHCRITLPLAIPIHHSEVHSLRREALQEGQVLQSIAKQNYGEIVV